MASLFLSSPCLNQNLNVPTASPFLRFGSQSKFPSLCRASKLVFPNLEADDFQHPLDKQNTRIIKAIPGLNEIGNFVRGRIPWEPMIVENTGTLVLVTARQLPSLYKLMAEAAEILNVKAPLLYIRQDPVPYVATFAVNDMPYVVVHSGLMDLLTLEELQAVFAHELGHLKCAHCLWLTFANIFLHGAKAIPGVGWLISQSVEEELVRWHQAAELSCDRASLLVAGDPKVVISVMMKLSGGCLSMKEELNVDAFLAQACAYDKVSFSSSIGQRIRLAHETKLSHPVPVLRAAEINELSGSEGYKTLLSSAKTNAVEMKKNIMEQVDPEKIMEQVEAEKKKLLEQVNIK